MRNRILVKIAWVLIAVLFIMVQACNRGVGCPSEF